jgi:hypothetical protein
MSPVSPSFMRPGVWEKASQMLLELCGNLGDDV